MLIEAGDARVLLDGAGQGASTADPVDDGLQVGRRRSAASAHQPEAELLGELLVRRRELVRCQRVARAIRPSTGRPALGMHITGMWANLERCRRCSLIRSGPVAQLRPIMSMPSGSSVVSAGGDLASDEHGPGGLDRHLDEDRQADPGLHDRLLAPVHGRLGLQQVLGGLDQQGVHPAVDETLRLLGERLLQEVRVGGVAEAGELGARTDRAEHPAHPAVLCLERLSGAPRDLGAGARELLDALLDAVVGEVGPVRAERVGLDRVDARLEIGGVDGLDDVGPRHVQDLVAALMLLEVLHRRSGFLQHGAHRPVGDHDALGQCLQQGLGTRRAGEVGEIDTRCGSGTRWHRNSLIA